MINKCQSMCKKGGLLPHKFASNSTEVISSIPEEDRASGLKNVDIFSETLPVERTLGVLWSIESDTFQFRIVLHDKPLTRRGILSTVSSIYDPLGFIAPVILMGKQILQRMCKDNIGWDEFIPEDLRMKWESWRHNLFELESIRINRCLKPDNFGEVKTVEYHHFSDASTSGYGQCSYLRLINDKKQVHCSLLMGKARVSPLKSVTIPRLELTAALVSVKVSSLLQRELNYKDAVHVYWSDSRVVLGYIANESKRFHVFVANRVEQIREQTDPSQWRYVDTKNNPADIASRGTNAADLVKSTWFSGPVFLWQPELPVKDEITDCTIDPLGDPEVRKVSCLASCAEPERHSSLLARLEYFSSWYRAVRAVAACLKFKALLKQRIFERQQDRTLVVNLQCPKVQLCSQSSVKELREAEIQIILSVQRESFSKELEILLRRKSAPDHKREALVGKESKLYRLDPFLDKDGLIRVGGRLHNSPADFAQNHPVVLPRKGHITRLLIRHCHERVQHQGRGLTTNELRSNGYWILGCSSAVSDEIYNCVICRKLRSTGQDQKMADLPFDRVDPAPPFSYCGVDYFGPFVVRERRKELKRYGVIFTCFTSRAVHLEIANSLDTDSFINALRRFLSLRGPIRQLRSDRGTNFLSAERELREALSELDDNQISEFLCKEGCDYFRFKPNVPSASHMGGVWERQIRTIRSVLARLLQQHGTQLDDESLRTLVCEVTAIVNSRPLSVENLNDPLSELPLTPNHLLTMKSKVLLPPPGKFLKPDLYTRKRWRRIQYIANEFWTRWRKEYLSNLQSRSKWVQKKRNMQIGDVVLLKEENLPRNQWRLGQVSDTCPEADGLVRKVSINAVTRSVDNKGKVVCTVTKLERPVHKLVLLKETDE